MPAQAKQAATNARVVQLLEEVLAELTRASAQQERTGLSGWLGG